MYIGPWQEYRLSQNQNNKTNTKEINDEILRNQLLLALKESLDPEAANKAIEAVNKTLENPRNNDTKRVNFPIIPAKERRIRTYRKPSDYTHTRLPTIAVYAYDTDRESIPSHRSTMSEPIHGTKMLFTPDTRPPSHRETRHISSNPSKRSDYDASGVLDVLRLQKKEESKKNKPDFSGMWKWNNNSNGNNNTDANNNNSNNGNGNSNVNSARLNGGQKELSKLNSYETKVDRVKKMHEIYRQHISSSVNDDDFDENGINKNNNYENQKVIKDEIESKNISQNNNSNNLNNSTLRMQLSPIRKNTLSSPYQKPQTPIVKDKELTNDDYHIVSKYFQQQKQQQQQQQSSPRSSIQLPSISIQSNPNSSPPSPSPLSSPFVNKSSTITSTNLKTKLSPIKIKQSPQEQKQNQKHDQEYNLMTDEIDNVDQTLYRPNSPDGLLAWCANLNTDFIDDLY